MTAPTRACTPALDAYLRRATWGLPEPRRQELWDELEEHVLTRTDHLLLSGLSPQSALTQALRELGPPSRVTLGMAKVYSMPKVLLATTILALGLSAALFALAGGNDKVISIPAVIRHSATEICTPRGSQSLPYPVLRNEPNRICYQVPPEFKGDGALIDLQTTKGIVQQLGGTLELKSNNMAEFRMPNGAGAGFITYRASGTSYIYVSNFLAALVSSQPDKSSVQINGYDQPTLTLGEKTLRLSSTGNPQVGKGIYTAVAHTFLNELLIGSNLKARAVYSNSRTSVTHRIKTNLPEGAVVVLIQRLKPEDWFTSSAQVQRDGWVDMKTEARSIRPVAAISAMKPVAPDADWPVLLIRASDLPLNSPQAGIFLPEEKQSTAR